jgi:nicotinamide-nucleotide amidase
MLAERHIRQAKDVLDQCRKLNLRLATAESCTGGLIASCLTAVPGSSHVFDRGFVTYDNGAKVEMLGVTEASLAAHGAVSEVVACAMAEGALENSAAQIAVATTGIAGPGGGTKTKPVGLVYIAVAGLGRKTRCTRSVINGNRESVRITALEQSLSMVEQYLSKRPTAL